MSIAECVRFHWDRDRYGKESGVSADMVPCLVNAWDRAFLLGAAWELCIFAGRSMGAAHFCWARHGSCAFLLGTAWELRIFAGRSMGMTDPQRGARCMRSSAVLGGRRWDRGVGIHCLLRVWYARNALSSSWRSPLGQDAR